MSARLILLAVVLMLLVGCGQKGPLYLPDDSEAAERYGPRPVQDEDISSAHDDTGNNGTSPDDASLEDES